MNKNIIRIFAGICLCMSISSCNNLLELDPTDAVPGEKIFSSVSQFERGVLGCYSTYHPEYNLLIGSAMSDECRLDSQNNGVNGFGNLLQRWVYSSEDDILYKAWKDNYATIYSINLLLENAAKVPVHNEEQREKLRSLTAELHGLRALVHFDLHRNFGPSDAETNGRTIPYITDTDINKKPGRISLNEFYQNIWNDLNNAGGIQHQINFRLQNNAVLALEARVALYQRNYPLAAEKATALIQLYPLEDAQRYERIWKDNNNTEVIFQLKRTNDNDLRPNTLWQNYATGRMYFRPSHQLMSMYEASDVRLQNFQEEEGDYIINKYPGNDYSNRINDVKLFRVSEMYLIRAEANFFTGKQQEALQDINTLRIKRNEDIQPISTVSLSEIMKERYLELSYEGHRYYDLKRLQWDISRNPEDLFSLSDEPTLTSSDKAYILPVPLKETLVNPNL
ncbi:RagB/SusD family nutrient uptake outer membrane protein [Chryseobacterium sp.]|uniref:RagB/SusD family nutrient uptake outer membrane protein n=1 Tax=Chryseobacterium sp. TaxID=1871047 RepID=UPI0025BD8D28|nr:RagB/SusD family nutrient uptake outer membrane protein [Chryseobacterium sp.]MBV8327312.1 RagB/SusD family nutrient uptake outer membrane protein [Chryseobacterium sp.]